MSFAAETASLIDCSGSLGMAFLPAARYEAEGALLNRRGPVMIRPQGVLHSQSAPAVPVAHAFARPLLTGWTGMRVEITGAVAPTSGMGIRRCPAWMPDKVFPRAGFHLLPDSDQGRNQLTIGV